jgi:cyclopropane fatty-acyl-phospholipid synthase-like methyltransferase
MARWNDLHRTFTISEPHEKFVEFAKEYLKPGMRVLDLGCGKGRHSLYCARMGIETHAVDISETVVESLRAESEKDQLFELLKVTKSDIRELPFPDAYFDAIICVNVINHGHKKDVEAYFKEATRVLKKSGLFFLVVAPLEFIEENRTDRTVEVEKNTFFHIDQPDGDVPHHVLDENEIRERLWGYDILKRGKSKGRSHWKDVVVTREEVIAKKR